MLPFLVSRVGVARGSLSRLLTVDAPRAIATSSAALQKAGKGKGAAPAGEDDDIVLQTFKEQQHHFRELMEGAKKIPLPLGGDDAAIKKYAEQMQALKKKIGMPDVGETVDATLNYKMQVARGNVRRYMQSALEGMQLGPEMSGVVNEVYAALDEVEAKIGGPLDKSNAKAWGELQSKIAAIAKQAGLDNPDAVKKEAVFDIYKTQIRELEAKVLDDAEAIKRRDGLEWVKVDLKNLKLKI